MNLGTDVHDSGSNSGLGRDLILALQPQNSYAGLQKVCNAFGVLRHLMEGNLQAKNNLLQISLKTGQISENLMVR